MLDPLVDNVFFTKVPLLECNLIGYLNQKISLELSFRRYRQVNDSDSNQCFLAATLTTQLIQSCAWPWLQVKCFTVGDAVEAMQERLVKGFEPRSSKGSTERSTNAILVALYILLTY